MTLATTKIYTVSELTQAIKAHLEPKFFHITLKGEITNLTYQASGHLYFSLKDERSQISCVLFKNVAITLNQPPKVGDKVLIKGAISLYVPRGSYQIVVSHLQQEGLGDLLLKLHELKDRLQKKGYFDPLHKKPLPKYPQVIGVITSPTGAVIHDILNVLQRRFKGFHLILNPVKVQGEGACQEIAQAIKEFNRLNLVDVIILARGGGSLEDLWAFNEEEVVEAVFLSKIPIISSIGHETDFSLTDFAADVRAPTPSAAAEIVLKEKSLQLEFLQKTKKDCLYYLSQILKQNKLQLASIKKQKPFALAEGLLGDYFQKIDDISLTLDQTIQSNLKAISLKLANTSKHLALLRPDRQLHRFKEKTMLFKKRLDQSICLSLKEKKEHLQHIRNLLDSSSLKPDKQLYILKEKRNHLQKRLDQNFSMDLQRKKEKLLHIKNLLDSLNPNNLLKKGYCIPFAENMDSVIISSKQLKMDDSLILQFYDGKVEVVVKKDPHG
ncbi:MAG: exodeoxyribonuclease VII large subunit [Chlamydiota bacterium]